MRAKEFDQGDRKQIHQILLWNHFIKGSPKNMLSSVFKFTEVTVLTLGGRNDGRRFILRISMIRKRRKWLTTSAQENTEQGRYCIKCIKGVTAGLPVSFSYN